MSYNFLIAEDDPELQRKLKEDLGSLSFVGEIFVASDGKEALQLLNEMANTPYKIDFICSDIHMPTMTGVEFLKRLRAKVLFKELPVLMLTSEATMDVVMQAVLGGADNYLLKPWNLKELEARIRSSFEKKNIYII